MSSQRTMVKEDGGSSCFVREVLVMLCGLLRVESRDGRFWSLCLGEERCKGRNIWEANLTCKAN